MRLPRFRVRTLLIAVALAGLFLGCSVTIHRLLNPGITVTVINETDSTLDHVQVTFTGGVCHAERVKPGGKATWLIRPQGDSDLILAYRDVNGRYLVETGNVYLEKGYGGSVHFHVEQGGVKVLNNIRLVPFLK